MVQIKGETYGEFVEKFKLKKTTDDCYTPDIVYNAIADWVEKEYRVKREDFVRPFYPGGDYEKFEYLGKIVVDNPPFSILSKIIKFYIDNDIKFFLFAPTLTMFSDNSQWCTALPIGINIIYDNGARVNTSFLTNLEPSHVRVRTVPELYQALKAANDENTAKGKKALPAYTYPSNVITSAQMYQFSESGISLMIPREESAFIQRLDSQKAQGRGIFGNGYLISQRCAEIVEVAKCNAAERKAAKCNAAIKWQLSDREKEIIKNMTN